MRKELESIKLIEDYLSDQLPAGERAAFEAQLANDPQLREELMLQQELMRGVERAALTQQIKQAGKQFIRWRHFTRWAGGGLGIVLIGVVVMYFVMKAGNQQTAYDGTQLPAYNEAGEKLWTDADKNIAAQTFTIQAGRDTVIETRGGIVLAVPANGFLDESGAPVTGPLSLVVKEALDAATVMRAGLSTMSGDQLLETGGMFFIDARKGEQRMRINPAAGIYAEVPADTIKPGMQLYSGKRLPDGKIDWVNPAPLEKDLVPVDILSLDFYPPHYLDSLQTWGYNSGDKKFTDSLYYSLAAYFRARPIQEPAPNSERVEETITDSFVSASRVRFWDFYFDICGINPAKIKTIWSNTFQNTLLATREFEERLRLIHLSLNAGVFDLYINNLDKPISYIDSLAAMKVSGAIQEQFLAFAARKEGKVKNGSTAYQKLRDYYQLKSRMVAEAISKTQEAFWKEQAALDRTAGQKKQEHLNDSVNRTVTNFQEEFALNLKEAARQLGYDTSRPLLSPDNVYKVQVVNTGWSNIDRAVLASTLNRTTLDITDSVTGKKAIIQYLPVTFRVEKANEYDRLYVYLLPDALSSFMQLDGIDGKYDEKLNELMKYAVVLVGYKGEQAFFYSQPAVKPKEYTGISLAPVSQNDLEQKLNGMGKLTQGTALRKEMEYFRFEALDQHRRIKNLKLQEFTLKVIWALYPCHEEWYSINK